VRSSAWQSLRHGHVRRTHRTDDGKMTSLFPSSLNNFNQVLNVLRFQVAKLRLTQYKILSINGEAFAIDRCFTSSIPSSFISQGHIIAQLRKDPTSLVNDVDYKPNTLQHFSRHNFR
jgi:hypothetical protein